MVINTLDVNMTEYAQDAEKAERGTPERMEKRRS